jgi:two-component system response regulator QseB
MRVLLVGTQPSVAVNSLRVSGYSVYWAHDKSEAEIALASDSYDLVLLDLVSCARAPSPPRHHHGDGTALVLARMLGTAVGSWEGGVEAGMCDPVAGTVDRAELGTLVRALARQCSSAFPHRCGDLQVDCIGRTAFKSATPLALAPREFALLQALIHEPLRVLSREELAAKLIGKGEKVDSNVIDVLVHRLRRKIGPDRILTVRGNGYRLTGLG